MILSTVGCPIAVPDLYQRIGDVRLCAERRLRPISGIRLVAAVVGPRDLAAGPFAAGALGPDVRTEQFDASDPYTNRRV